jgi:hypothetical protein
MEYFVTSSVTTVPLPSLEILSYLNYVNALLQKYILELSMSNISCITGFGSGL